jgi:hypothetical protein
MAMLINRHTGRHVMLHTLHAFGRHPTACRTVMPCPEVSKVHALLRWNANRWEMQDQSRNGSFMNGVRLPRNSWLALTGASDLSMGDCPEAQWRVLDLAPPIDCLFSPTDGQVIALQANGMFLPDPGPAQWHIHCQETDWIAESSQGAVALEDGGALTLGELEWEVVLCTELGHTIESSPLPVASRAADIVLRFELSQDEEHAQLILQLPAGEIDLGERIHHYLLATLARLRLQDALRGIDAHSQGWVTTAELTRMLGVDASYVNIQIFRARQQFAEALPPDLPAPVLIERRRGDLRIGNYGFTVQRGAVVEGGLVRRPSGELACA